MIVNGPRIPVMVSGDAGDSYLVSGNAMLRMLQALVQPNVIGVGFSTPPGSPSNGDMYVVGSGATGLWAGHDNAVAYWSTDNASVPLGEWEFFFPFKGWIVTDQSNGSLYIYTGVVWEVTSGGAVTGSNLAPDLPWTLEGAINTQNTSETAANFGGVGTTVAQYISGNMIVQPATGCRITVWVSVIFSAPITEFVLIRTLKNDLTTVDVTPITFGGTGTPTFASLGLHTSDPIAVEIDGQHDYYFGVAGNASGTGSFQTFPFALSNTTASGIVANSVVALSTAWASSIGAGGGWAAAFPVGPGVTNAYIITSLTGA